MVAPGSAVDDAIVIGGGPAGLTVAAALADRGLRCTLVDSGGLCAGRLSTHAAAGTPANTKVGGLLANFSNNTIFDSDGCRAALQALERNSTQLPPSLGDPSPHGWTTLTDCAAVFHALTDKLRAERSVRMLTGTVDQLSARRRRT